MATAKRPNEAVRAYLEQTELERIAKTLRVPTNDAKVRLALRHFGEPITLFGEDKGDRRARLRLLMASRVKNDEDVSLSSDESEEEVVQSETTGSEELLAARRFILEESKRRARARLKAQAEDYEAYVRDEVAYVKNQVEYRKSKQAAREEIVAYGSQSGFSRPVSAVRFSPWAEVVAVADWSGAICLMDLESMDFTATTSHTLGQISGLCWSPKANILASGTMSGKIVLSNGHDLSTELVLEGHIGRAAQVDYDPSGTLLASASHDGTWRLWDCDTGSSLIAQDGHAKGVHVAKCQTDGSLLLTAGLDGIGRVWDLRTGKTAMVLDGHLREIYSGVWLPNGYQAITGGADNNALVWDLRQVAKVYEIPAHNSVVSDMVIHDGSLITSSYDKTIKMWDLHTWHLEHMLETSDRIMSVDMINNFLCAGRWDRSVEIFRPDS